MTAPAATSTAPCGCRLLVPDGAHSELTHVDGACEHSRKWAVRVIDPTIARSFPVKAAFVEVVE